MPRTSKPEAPSDVQGALKRAFAEALLRNPTKPAEAAFSVLPGAANVGQALRIANEWPADPLVKSTMAALVEEHGAEHFLPTKEEVARELLEIARDGEAENRQRLDAYKLYGEFMGFSGKGAELKVDVTSPMADIMAKIAANGRPKPSTAG